MTEQLQILIKTVYQDKGAKQAERDLDKLNKTTAQAGRGLVSFSGVLGAAAISLTGLGVAAKVAYDTIKQGAALDLARQQFDNLSESINTTGDALLNNLRAATRGMVSDAALIQNATDIINVGLGSTEEEVTRLARVITTLGIDMNTAVLTFANNSRMRLDSLGLSVEAVETRIEELKRSGRDIDDAFDVAVLELLEEKTNLLGDASETTAGKISTFEAALTNAKDAAIAATVESDLFAFAIERLTDLAQGYADVQMVREDVEKRAQKAVDQGLISQRELNTLLDHGVFATLKTAEARQASIDILNDLIKASDNLTKEMEDSDRVLLQTAKTWQDANTKIKLYSDGTTDLIRNTEELNDKFRQQNNLLDDVGTANAKNRGEINKARREAEMLNATIDTAGTVWEKFDREASAAGGTLGSVTRATVDLGEAQRDAANTANAIARETISLLDQELNAIKMVNSEYADFALSTIPQLNDEVETLQEKLLTRAAQAGLLSPDQLVEGLRAIGADEDAIANALQQGIEQQAINELVGGIAAGTTDILTAFGELDTLTGEIADFAQGSNLSTARFRELFPGAELQRQVALGDSPVGGLLASPFLAGQPGSQQIAGVQNSIGQITININNANGNAADIANAAQLGLNNALLQAGITANNRSRTR